LCELGGNGVREAGDDKKDGTILKKYGWAESRFGYMAKRMSGM
jgi:hypothetical protein